MALPIPIVVENFGAYYMEQKKRAVIAAKKQDLVEAKIAENASGQMEMNQLASILQTKSGPFKTTPESPLDVNPAASLRIHQLHATPVLLSGVATLVLTKQEKKVLETHYKCTIQRLHQNTPRAVVFFLAGCLPLKQCYTFDS